MTQPTNKPTVSLRPPQSGDMGWVVQQHGEIYWREYGWDASFEALVLKIVSGIVQKWQPDLEKCWIAEVDGVRVGSAFVVRRSKTTAQLRLVILTADARGLGLGGKLCDECIAFARATDYKKMVLWTNSGLHAARAIYLKLGLKLTKSEAYTGYGHELVGETWELKL